jgi:L-serine dehydratase
MQFCIALFFSQPKKVGKVEREVLVDMKKISDIFNEVIGPVMIGPSSSHTAGPARIGKCISFLLEDIVKVEISFSKYGSYISTYEGQGADRGFAAGLMGWEQDDERISDALSYTKDIEISAIITEENFEHPNTSIIKAVSSSGDSVEVKSISTGGGNFEITEIDGLKLQVTGEFFALLVYGISVDHFVEKDILKVFEDQGIEYIENNDSNNEGLNMMSISLYSKPGDSVVNEILKIEGVQKIRLIEAVLPVTPMKNIEMPFSNAKEMISYYKLTSVDVDVNIDMYRASIEYEKAISGWSEKEIVEYASYLLDVMIESVCRGFDAEEKHFDYLKPKGKQILKAYESGKMIPGGLINRAMIYAVAVMEGNASRNKVIAAPTAGSCGVIPGILAAMLEEKIADREELVKSLLAAGLIGAFISNDATFAAETGGCQAEIGSASAMAAGALIQAAGGDILTGLGAASVAIQNMLGLICDPVNGGVEIPCISRNASGVSNAVVSANLLMGGYDYYIPFHEAVETMRRVGLLMPEEHRCTCKGGLCLTNTAKELSKADK